MKLKVLVADKFPDKYIQQMKDLDLEVVYNPKLGEKDLAGSSKRCRYYCCSFNYR